MEIANWKSMSEYKLHSNFGKTLTRVIGGISGAKNIILPLSYFLNIRKEYLRILWNFCEQTRVILDNQSSVSEVVLNAAARSSCFNVRVIESKN